MVDKWNLTHLAYLIGELKGKTNKIFLDVNDTKELKELVKRLEKELDKVYEN